MSLNLLKYIGTSKATLRLEVAETPYLNNAEINNKNI